MSDKPHPMRMLPFEAERAAESDHVARLPADNASVVARLARIEQTISAQGQATNEQLAALSDAVSVLRRMLQPDDLPAAAREAPARTNPESHDPEAGIEFSALQQIAALTQALHAVENSTTWRATAPARKLASSLSPSTRAALRQLARRIFWILTPQRMPMRRQWIVYAPQNEQTVARLASLSSETRNRLRPLRRAYGPTAIEQLDIYPAGRPGAPIFVFIHGGGWRATEARNAAFAADTFVGAGAAYVVLDFIGGQAAGGDLRVIVDQVCRGIAWVHRNAASFGGDAGRLYLGGHSSGAHLCAMALVSDWQAGFGLPADLVKGAVLMSGLYDLKSVRSARNVRGLLITDEIEHAMSPRRHIERLNAPVVITCGGAEAPEFRQQSRDLHVAATTAGKTAELIEAAHFGHLEMAESLGSPYGPNGRAALRLMGLRPE